MTSSLIMFHLCYIKKIRVDLVKKFETCAETRCVSPQSALMKSKSVVRASAWHRISPTCWHFFVHIIVCRKLPVTFCIMGEKCVFSALLSTPCPKCANFASICSIFAICRPTPFVKRNRFLMLFHHRKLSFSSYAVCMLVMHSFFGRILSPAMFVLYHNSTYPPAMLFRLACIGAALEFGNLKRTKNFRNFILD